jgi:AcrR family transcriptional regulator
MVTARDPADLTARARIRDAAFGLLAAQGEHEMTIRAVASAAGTSSTLVIHHYGSKQGVIDAIDEWVRSLLLAATQDDAAAGSASEANIRRLTQFEQLLDEQPLLRAYLRRMLLEQTAHGLDWFAQMVQDGATDLRRRAENGLARPADDEEAVAAVLTAVALVPLLLPQHLERVLGGGEDSLDRWQAASSDIFGNAIYPASPKGGPKAARNRRPRTR